MRLELKLIDMSAIKIFKALVVVLVVVLVVFNIVKTRVLVPKSKEPTREDFSALTGGAGKLVEKSSGIYEVVGQSGKIGVAFDSEKIKPNVKGYNAPIRMLGYLNSSGKIERVEIFKHKETPYYFKIVVESELLKDMEGKTPEEIYRLDAISGATVSSKAIIKEIALDSAKADSEVFGRDHSELFAKAGAKALLDFSAFLTIALLILAVVSIVKLNAYLKYASWALGFFVVGILMREPLSISHVFRLFDGSIPTWNRLGFFILFWGSIVLGLFFGRVYCLRVCPFGAVQEAAYKIGHGSKIDEGSPSKFSQLVRYGIFLAIAILFFGLGIRSSAEFEPYITLFSLRGGAWGWIFVIATIAVSFIVKRFWCRYLCPFGTFMELLSWLKKRGRAKDEELKELS